MGTHIRRSLLLTNDFPPVISGIATVFYHIWKHYDTRRTTVLTPHAPGDSEFDAGAAFRSVRFPVPFAGTTIGKIGRMKLTAFITAWMVAFRGVREIHAGQILSCGPVGWFFQRVFGIPCCLWVYGGETTDVYRRSRMEEWLVTTLLRSAARIVTNSPAVTKEFLDFGIPRERIIEIIPAVDGAVFTPGSRPAALEKRFGLAEKTVLLTVARLTPRKGHDLVLKALDLLRTHGNLHYVIVGSGEDRGRLEGIVADLGLDGRVIFAGHVADSELPDYYRLCDIYAMPNRDIVGSTDSMEGFGISFIEANACGKPSIAGRAGGTAAAVVDGVTGYLVDPDKPEELAERIAGLLDEPQLARQLGANGRERVEREFDWCERARVLSEACAVDMMPG